MYRCLQTWDFLHSVTGGNDGERCCAARVPRTREGFLCPQRCRVPCSGRCVWRIARPERSGVPTSSRPRPCSSRGERDGVIAGMQAWQPCSPCRRGDGQNPSENEISRFLCAERRCTFRFAGMGDGTQTGVTHDDGRLCGWGGIRYNAAAHASSEVRRRRVWNTATVIVDWHIANQRTKLSHIQ